MSTDFTGKTFGSYKLVAPLGRGGMASVYRGYQESIDRSVAVKVLPLEYMHDPNFSERFIAEARVLAKLVHPSIMPLYDFGMAEVPYIIVPLMAHGTLADRLTGGPLPIPEIMRIAVPIASALDYAHKQGVIHRDLKPSNILFDQNDTPFLGDFGIAKALEATSGLTGTGIIGTPDFMSPEQAQGEVIDGRSDVYALGVVVYQLLTGQQLFRATTPMGIVLKHMTEAPPSVRLARPDLPVAVEAILQRALAKRREQRYQTASEFISALGSALGQPTWQMPAQPATGDMGTFVKPLTPAQAAASHRSTGAVPQRPPTSGTAMPPMPPTGAAPARRGGVGGFLLGSTIGIVVGVIALLILLGLCCAGTFYIASFASTSTPTVAPKRVVTPTPDKSVLFKDDFSDPQSGWSEETTDNANGKYANGAFEFTVKKDNWLTWSSISKNLANFQAEVTANGVGQEPDTVFGLVCDYQDTENFYYAGISSKGQFALIQFQKGKHTYLNSAGKLATSKVVVQGQDVYRVGLACGHGSMTLSADGKTVETVPAPGLSGGDIGIFVWTLDLPGGESRVVRFTDMLVTALP